MAASPSKRADGIAYREALPDGWDGSGRTILLLHGYPTSSYLWRNVMPDAAEAGWRAIAPDLPGFGDSPADLPGTWERQVEHVERFRRALGLDQVALGVHDWGGLIGLRWACDHPDAVSALFITDTGFFPDGRWHGMAKTLRTEGEGEQVLENINRDLFGDGAAPDQPGAAPTTRSTSTGRRTATTSAGAANSTCTAPATSRSWSPTTAGSAPLACRR